MTLRAFLSPHITAMQVRYAVTVVGNAGNGEPQPVGLEVEFVSVRIERRITPLLDLAALVRLVRLFRRSRFAAVQSVTPKAGLLAMLAGFVSRVPVRVHIFTGQVWVTRRGAARWLLKLMDRVIAWCATHILVDSPSQRAFLLEEGVVTPEKSRVLGKGSISGVDATRFKSDPGARSEMRARLGYRDDSVVFLYLGRLHRDKGVLDLAAAFSRLAARDERPRLLIVGPDEDDMEAAMRAALGDTAPRAAFAGYTDRPEQHIAAADVFCLPSYREGFGTTVIEAAAAGIPAIGSRIYGIIDAIVEGETGLLHTPGDVNELAEKMEMLMKDPTLRQRLGAQARQRAVNEFNQQRITQALLDYYRGALGE